MNARQKRYHQERASEAQATRLARETDLGQFYWIAGEEYLVWPNGEKQLASEYQQWLALQAINAQVGING